MRFHFYSVLLWRCQNLELENGGHRVVRPGILGRPFDAWDARRVARGHAPDAGCLRHPHPNATLFGVVIVPADGTRACHGEETETSVRRRFCWAALGQDAACQYLVTWGVGTYSTMADREITR